MSITEGHLHVTKNKSIPGCISVWSVIPHKSEWIPNYFNHTNSVNRMIKIEVCILLTMIISNQAIPLLKWEFTVWLLQRFIFFSRNSLYHLKEGGKGLKKPNIKQIKMQHQFNEKVTKYSTIKSKIYVYVKKGNHLSHSKWRTESKIDFLTHELRTLNW